MPDVADYRVISDGGVNIKTGGDIDHTFNFDLGTEVKHDQHVCAPVLLCVLKQRQ
jgi:hypothetical protein